MLFIQVILPVFAIILAGYILEKRSGLDFRTLTYSSLYLFTPALVFASITHRQLNLELSSDLFVFMLLYTASLWGVAVVGGWVLGTGHDAGRALALSTVMMNVGNFGLPLAYFAFGDAGLEVSVMTFVFFNIPLSTLAIVLAQGKGVLLGQALINTAKIPIFHAVIAAFLCKALALSVPDFILRPLDLLGQAAVPVMLVLLGMQLARTELKVNIRFLSLASLIRLCLSPLVAWGLTTLLGMGGLTQSVVILQTSTPAAVLPLLYSVRFGTRPDLVASAIFFTTVLSAFSLTVLLYLLN